MTKQALTRLAVVVFVLGSVLFWIWAFSPFAPNDNADRIPDDEFPEAAEARCAESLERVYAIAEGTFDVESPADRAVLVDEATSDLEELIVDLQALVDEVYADLAVGVSDEGRLDELDEWQAVIGRWLDDWRVYNADRRMHAERLRTEGDVSLRLSLVDDVDVAQRLSGFANVNEMESCATPEDV